MAGIEQIQALLIAENKKLKEDLGSEIIKQVGGLLDTRLEAHEAKLMAEIRALQKRTESLENGNKAEEGLIAGTATAKRAWSEPGLRSLGMSCSQWLSLLASPPILARRNWG